MKSLKLLLIAQLAALGILGNRAGAGIAQSASQDCALGDQVCAEQQRTQYNPALNYRTPSQIYQRRVNQVEQGCYGNDSSTCSQLDQQLDSAQENPTLEQLQEMQEEERENDQNQ